MSVKNISFHLQGISEMRGIKGSGGDFDISPRDGQAQEIYSIDLERLNHSAAQAARPGVSLSFHGRDVFMIPGGKHTLCQERAGQTGKRAELGQETESVWLSRLYFLSLSRSVERLMPSFRAVCVRFP